MKPLIETSDGMLGGRQVTFDIKLEEEGIQGNFQIDALGFKKGSVEVFCGAGTGISGKAKILQRNTIQGKGFELSTPREIDFTEGETTGEFDFEFTGRFIALDISQVTFGTEGRVKVMIVVKN